MSKDKLLVVKVGGEKRAIIPVIKANLNICNNCGYSNGGLCLRKPKIIEQVSGRDRRILPIFRNCIKNSTLH